MGNKGKRKYQCEDCKSTFMVHWIEFNRAARPRCIACGSACIEPYSPRAKEDREIGYQNVLEHNEDDRTDVTGTGKKTQSRHHT